MRYRRVKVPGATYFFTLVMHGRQRIFSEASCVNILLEAISDVKRRHPFEIEAQVILPDHLHAMWTLPEADAEYSTRWRLIKEGFTRRYLKANPPMHRSETARRRGEQPMWQKRFWEHLIRDERDFASHLDYIHYNPVKHGLVSTPREWKNSTFDNWVERGAYEPTWGADVVPSFPEWLRFDE